MVTHFDNTPLLFCHPNVGMNVCQWQPTLPIQPQKVVQSYQPVQLVAPTSTPLVNTSLPSLQVQNVVPQLFQAGPSTQCPQVLGPRTLTPLVGS